MNLETDMWDMRKNDENSVPKTSTEARKKLPESAQKSQQEHPEGKDKKRRVAEKCECPPGCVGLPCCT
jgi:hypothetical protein